MVNRAGFLWVMSKADTLLSNVVLDELDKELERRGHRFVRYGDDCNIYVRAGVRVSASWPASGVL